MRALHADLTTAQQAATRTPYMRVYLEKGATNYTVSIADELLMVDHTERRWGGEAAITIDDSAGDWKTRDLRGYKVTVGYGYNTASGDLKSDAQPLWVFQDEVVSQAGKITKVLHCIDLLMALQVFTVGEGADRIDGDPATMVGSFVAGETVTGNNSSDTATLLSASSAGDDDPHIVVRGASGDFSGDTIATGDGGATLTDAGGLGYTAGGSGVSIGWSGTLSIEDAVTHLLAGHCSLTAHGTDTTRAFTPTIIIDWNTPVLNVIRYVMEMTKSVLRVENDGNVDMYYLDPAPAADYTYGATHVIFNSTQRRGIAEPERVVFVNQFPTEMSDYTYFGADETATAGLIEGWKITRVYQDPSIGSDADAASRADAAVHQAEQNSSIGLLVVPHNCGQEIADWVAATDPRTNQAFGGRVQQLRHIWQPGSYMLELVLGGMREASRAWTMPLRELQEELEGYARWDEVTKTFEPIRLPGYRELTREMERLYEEEVEPTPTFDPAIEAQREAWEEGEVEAVQRWVQRQQLQQQLPPTVLPKTPEQAEKAREELRELAQRQFPWIEEQVARVRGWREIVGQWVRGWLHPGGGGFR